MDLLIRTNIAPSKVNLAAFKRFVHKWIPQVTLKDRTALVRSSVGPLYEAKLAKIRKLVANGPVHFIVDETTDPCGRFVINFLVGPLNCKPFTPRLVHVGFIDRTNADAVVEQFITVCQLLWPTKPPNNKKNVVTTDQVSVGESSNYSLNSPPYSPHPCLKESLGHGILGMTRDSFPSHPFMVLIPYFFLSLTLSSGQVHD